MAKNVPDINYDCIPMSALNCSSRLKLSLLLNIEQALPNSKGITRDYRGLAELMGFEYNDIRNFQRRYDQTKEILEAWETKAGSSVAVLLKMLDELERFDVIEEILPLINNNVVAYLKKKQQSIDNQPLQVAEISSCPSANFQADNPDHLSIEDGRFGLHYYDAYVCYVDEDLEFVRRLCDNLENPDFGIKLFIRERDLRLGVLEYDAYVRLIEERCRRVLVILSPAFISSPECDFQAKFAAGLGIDQRIIKIIPVVYKSCKIPSLLSCLSKVDFTRDTVQDWAWKKIIYSLRSVDQQSFVFHQPMLTAPPTIFQLQAPPPPHSRSPSPLVEEIISEDLMTQPLTSELTDSSSSISSVPSASTSRKPKWFKSIKDRFQS